MKKKYERLLKIILIFVCAFCTTPYVSALSNKGQPNITSNVKYNEDYTEATVLFNLDAVATVRYNILSIKDKDGNQLDINNPNFHTTENGMYPFYISYTVIEDKNEDTKKDTDNIAVANISEPKEMIIDVKINQIVIPEELAIETIENSTVPETVVPEVKDNKNAAVAATIVDTTKIYVSSTGDDANDGSQASPVATLTKAQELLQDGGTIYVMNNIELTEKLNITKNTIITSLNPAKPVIVKRASTLTEADMITSRAKITLTLQDIIVDGGAVFSTNPTSAGYNATLKRSTTNTGVSGWAVIEETNATINLKSGAILQNNDTSKQYRPGACRIDNGGMNMEKGAIIKNCQQNIYHTGGIAAINNTSVTMAGEITGCYTAGTGAAISAESKGSITIEGANIHNNYSKGKGSAVNIASSRLVVVKDSSITNNGTAVKGNGAFNSSVDVTVGGKVVIADNIETATNTPNNLILGTKLIKVDGLTADSNIHLNTNKTPEEGDIIGTLVSGENLDTIVSDTVSFCAGKAGASSDVVWKKKLDVYVSNSGNDTTGLGTQSLPVASLTKAQEMLAEGRTIHVIDNLNVDTELNVTKNMTITSDDPTKPVMIKRTADLSIITATQKTININNIIFDGGAEFSTDINSEKYNATLKRSIKNNGRFASNKSCLAVVNTELNLANVTIQNADCSSVSGAITAIGGRATELSTDAQCVIKNCQNTTAPGGAIRIEYASKMNLQGTFMGCYSGKSGGVIFAVYTDYSGGILNVIENCDFHNNVVVGTNGGAVSIENSSGTARFLIRNSSFTNNSLVGTANYVGGGAIGLTKNGLKKVIFENVTITENTISGPMRAVGGALGSSNIRDYTIEVSGKVMIENNKNLTTGKDSNLFLNNENQEGEVLAKGLSTDSRIYVADWLSEGTEISGGQFGEGSGYVNCIINDVDNRYHAALVNGKLVWQEGGLDKVYVSSSGDDRNVGSETSSVATLAQAQKLVITGGTIYVMDDIEVPTELTITKNINVTSYDITKPVTVKRVSDSKLFNINPSVTLNVTDIILDGGAKYDIASSSVDYDMGLQRSMYNNGLSTSNALITMKNATLNIKGVLIQNASNNSTSVFGGAINASGTSVLAVDDKSIFKNCSQLEKSGGAIYTTDTTTLSMEGQVYSCYAKEAGSAIYIDGTSLPTLKNVNICNNAIGTTNGGAVYSAVNITVKEKVILINNFKIKTTVADNLVLQESKKLLVDNLTGDSDIRLSMDPSKEPNIDDIIGEVISGANQNCIISNSDSNFSGYTRKSSTDIIWRAEESKQVYVSNAGDDISGEGTKSLPVATLARAQELLQDNGIIYVMTSIDMDTGLDVIKNMTITSMDSTAPVIIKRTADICMIDNIVGGKVNLENIILDGGAIFSTDNTAKGYHSTLKRSTVNTAAFTAKNSCIDAKGELNLINTTIQNVENVSQSMTGAGAIKSSNVLNIDKNSKFENCQAMRAPGAIYVDASAVPHFQGTYMGCAAVMTTGAGGAIFDNSSQATYENCAFLNNAVTDSNSNGGAIRIIGNKIIKNCTFTNNSAGKSGSAINAINLTAPLLIENCVANGNTIATKNGGTISIDNSQDITVKGKIVIEDNHLMGNYGILENVVLKGKMIRVDGLSNDSSIRLYTNHEPVLGEAIGMVVNGGNLDRIHGDYDDNFYGATGTFNTQLIWRVSVLNSVYVASTGSDSYGLGTVASPFATLTKAQELLQDGGTIYVKDNIQLSKGYKLDKNVTITSDSALSTPVKITATNTLGDAEMFNVSTKKTLTFENIILDGGAVYSTNTGDSKYDSILKRSTNNTGITHTGTYAGVLVVAAEGKANFKTGVTIQNCEVNGTHRGGAVNLIRGSLDVDGATFKNCSRIGTASAYGGGAIYVYNDALNALTVSNATFKGCYSSKNGGAIEYDTPTTTAQVLKDVTISECKSAGKGGAVYVSDKTKNIILENSTITNNGVTTKSNGGVYSAGDVTVKQKVIIKDNYDDNKVVSNLVLQSGKHINADGLTVDSDIHLDTGKAPVEGDIIGTLVSGGNLNKIVSDIDINFLGEKAETSSNIVWKMMLQDVYVSKLGNDTTGLGTQSSPVATMDKAQELLADGRTIYVMNDIEMSTGLVISKNMTIASLDSSKPVTIKRKSDIRVIDIAVDKTVNINSIILDGGASFSTNTSDANYKSTLKRSITNNGLVTNDSIIGISKGELNINNTTIQNAEVVFNQDRGGAVYATGSAILNIDKNTVMKDCQNSSRSGGAIFLSFPKSANIQGTYEGCYANVMGGAINDFSDSKVTWQNCNFHNNMVNGTSSNTNSGYGGAVYINHYDTSGSGNTWTDIRKVFKDCIFTDNYAYRKGSGIGVFRCFGPIQIEDCTFTDNTVETNNGGVIGSNQAMTVLLKSKVVIKENYDVSKKASNLVLQSGKRINADGLTVDSDIHLNTGKAPVIGDVIGTLVSGGNLDKIVSDIDTDFFGEKEATSSNIIWKAMLQNAYVSNLGNDTTGLGTQSSPVATMDKAQELLADSGTIYVMNDIEVSTAFVASKNMTIASLDSSKPVTIKRKSDIRVIDIAVDKTVNINSIILDGGASFSTNTSDANYKTTLKRSITNNGLVTNDSIIGISKGVLNINGTTIQNAEVVFNQDRGGAVYATGSAILNIDKNTVMKDCQNSSRSGGAIFLSFPKSANIQGTYEGCYANVMGGAINDFSDSKVTWQNCNFHNNMVNGSTAGTANGYGGAVYINHYDTSGSGDTWTDVRKVFKDCIFTDNYAYRKGSGIGVFRCFGPIQIEDCTFTDNTVETNNGGVIGSNQAMTVLLKSKVVIKENYDVSKKASNLVLQSGKRINADGLTVDSDIHLNTGKAPVIGDVIGTLVSGGNLDKIVSDIDTDFIGEKDATSANIIWKLKTIPLPSAKMTKVEDKEIYSLEVSKPTTIHKDISFDLVANATNITSATVTSGYIDTVVDADASWITSGVVPSDGVNMQITNAVGSMSDVLIDCSKQYYVHIKNNFGGVYSNPIDLNSPLLKQTMNRVSDGDNITISMELDDTLKTIGTDMDDVSGIEQVAYALTPNTNALKGTFISENGFYGIQKYAGLKTNVVYDLKIDQKTRSKILEQGTEIVYMYVKDVIGNITEIPVSVNEVLLDVEVPTDISVFALTNSKDEIVSPNVRVKNYGTIDTSVNIDTITTDSTTSLKIVDDKASYSNDELALSISPVKNLTFTKMNILHVKDILLGSLSSKTREGYFTFEGKHSENIQASLESKFIMKYSFTTINSKN